MLLNAFSFITIILFKVIWDIYLNVFVWYYIHYNAYEFKLKEHNNIYQELLSENDKLRARIDRNEIMIREIIDDKRKNYLLTT